MSVKKKSIQYVAAAILVSATIIAASILYMGFPIPSNQSTSSVQGGQSGTLAIRLTDPPQVPSLTSSLNLTYSSLGLLVGEPTGTQGQLNTTTVTVTPTNGSATIDLLKLQNVSQTVALASLPNDSILFSVAFNVTSISIDVNGTVSPVSLATGGSTWQVTIAHPTAFTAGDFALLQLNPVVVNTPSGYQLIPSSVGVMGHGEGHDEVGDQHQLTNNEISNLKNARGNVTASIVALSVADNVTTFTVLVNNSASIPINLNAIGLHGNFTVTGNFCPSFGNSTFVPPVGEGDQHSNTTQTETHTNTTQTEGDMHSNMTQMQSAAEHCMIPVHMSEVVFVPLNSSTTTTTSTSTSCATGQLVLASMMNEEHDYRGYSLGAGQCVMLTFTG